MHLVKWLRELLNKPCLFREHEIDPNYASYSGAWKRCLRCGHLINYNPGETW